jgi:hypothetical protein
VSDELDDALAQVRRELEQARAAQKQVRGAAVEKALALKLAAIQAATLAARAEAERLDAELAPLRDEELNLREKFAAGSRALDS